MIDKFFQKGKGEWRARARRFLEMDIINLLNGTLILPAPAFYHASDTATTIAVYPSVSDISDLPTLVMPAITRQLPKTPSGNLV